MNIELKLYKLQKHTHYEWGKSKLEFESYFLSSDLEKTKEYLATLGILLNENCVYKKYYQYDRAEEEYSLTELECKML
jgi:hypothetical protein